MTERANVICILEILKEYSDQDNILMMSEIISKMNNIYGIKPDRRTVYSAIGLLNELGYDISDYEDNGVGYYLRGRGFEQSEIQLLTDAVYSFPFISAKQSEKLISKLHKQLSVHKRKKYTHLKVSRPEKKTDNRQVFLNIELLDEAISKKKQVSFSYLQYGFDKKLHSRRETPYIVNPYNMVFMNEHYYLVCNFQGYQDMSFYRIDRIKDITILETDCDRKIENKEKTKNVVYAFAGEPEYITMHCDNEILGDVIDKFGTEAFILPIDDKRFKLRISMSPQDVQFWALQYVTHVEVIEPLWLRKEVIKSIRQNKYDVR